VTLGVLWLTKPLWAPDNEKPVKSSLAVISAVALAILENHSATKPLTALVLRLFGDTTTNNAEISNLSHFLTAAVMVCVYIANRFAGDRTAMKAHPTKIDVDFPEQTYKEQHPTRRVLFFNLL
jgi:hypothetical protein